MKVAASVHLRSQGTSARKDQLLATVDHRPDGSMMVRVEKKKPVKRPRGVTVMHPQFERTSVVWEQAQRRILRFTSLQSGSSLSEGRLLGELVRFDVRRLRRRKPVRKSVKVKDVRTGFDYFIRAKHVDVVRDQARMTLPAFLRMTKLEKSFYAHQ